MEHEDDSDTNYNWWGWYSHQKIAEGTGGLRGKRVSGYHPNDSIIEIGQNTEKSPGELRIFAFTQTPVEDHQLTMRCKSLKEVK